MNILVVSYESWRDTNNGGNVLSNIFSAFPDADIAQVYCNGELPQNSICRKYFQISDRMLFTSEKGKRLEERDYSVDNTIQHEVVENKIKNRIPPFLNEAALLARELLWVPSGWKTRALERFVTDFKPDIIFAPCYSYFHVSMLALHIKSIAQCPMISYISDDNYSLKQFRFAPSFWINRCITRKWIRKHFSKCSLVYTMTDIQKREYEALLGRPMKVLCKFATFTEFDKDVGHPIKFIYAGGLYLNRWKVLSELSDVLAEVNKTIIKAELHIYSGSRLGSQKEKKLNDGINSFMHAAVPYAELIEKYRESDVAVHVESFDIKNRLITRLSFSTKIIDCMNSGCAILAIGPATQAGIAYLKDNDAAVCINDMKQIPDVINKLIEHPDMIGEYARKANDLGRKNHNKVDIEEMLRDDFFRISANSINCFECD